MTTKQTMLQFVQQIMHEGIDALIDRIACRVIERLDERNAAKQQGVGNCTAPSHQQPHCDRQCASTKHLGHHTTRHK